jgi:hypothetical protein
MAQSILLLALLSLALLLAGLIGMGEGERVTGA